MILCRSADRRSKERAMHDKFSRRIEAALDRLAARLVRSKKPVDPATVNRRIGRILQQNSACVVSPNPMPHKPLSSTASA